MASKLHGLKTKVVLRTLERYGFVIRRITGSHYILKKGNRTVTVPFHRTDLKIGTLKSIIKQADLTVAEFLDLLES